MWRLEGRSRVLMTLQRRSIRARVQPLVARSILLHRDEIDPQAPTPKLLAIAVVDRSTTG
jgi:hypothetical protein